MDKDIQAKVESILNRTDGSLPFGYYHPGTEGKLTWNCGYDPNGKIVSIFCYNMGTHKDRQINILPKIEEAISTKEILIKDGWQKLKAPEITVSYPNGDKKALSRKQKRFLANKLKKMSKDNPFEKDELEIESQNDNDDKDDENSNII